MTLESLTSYGLAEGFSSPATGAVDLNSLLLELQGFRVGRISGANATRTPLIDIATVDTPLAVVLHSQTQGAGMFLRVVGPASLSVPTGGQLTIASSNNTSRGGIVFWWDKSGVTSWDRG